MLTKKEQQLEALLEDLERAAQAGLVSWWNQGIHDHAFRIHDSVTLGQYETLEEYFWVTYPALDVTVTTADGPWGAKVYIRFSKR